MIGPGDDPTKPSPAEIARIQSNVAKMRAAGAPESDVAAYLQQEDSARSQAPTPDTSLSFRNLGRSFTQGATFGFGDEMGLTNRDAENAFKAQHPIADFAAKFMGGSIAPAAAIAAAPALGTTLGGAAALGGVTGALQGAGDADGSLTDRGVSAVEGGLLGAGAGALLHGAVKGAGALVDKVLDRMHPERAVQRAAAQLVAPEAAGIKARMAAVDQIAPGGASIATTSIPPEGERMSRLLPTLRAVGASPTAGESAERSLISQNGALQAAKEAIGAKMDALKGEIPINSQTRSVLNQVRDILGSKAPSVPAGAETAAGDNPLGIEMSVPFSFGSEKQTVDIQDARDALSRLRYMERQAVKRGTEANGATLHDIASARAALQSLIYEHAPGFADLDRPYASMSQQQQRTTAALKTVQRSRANYAGNEAYGATSGSLGGSLPRGSHGVVMDMLDHLLTNRAGAADAVARMIAKPGGPEMVDQLLSALPTTSQRGIKTATAATAAGIPAMRGLLTPVPYSP